MGIISKKTSKKLEVKLTILLALGFYTAEYHWLGLFLIIYIASLFGLGLHHIIDINKFRYWRFKDKAKFITFIYLMLILFVGLFPKESPMNAFASWFFTLSFLSLIFMFLYKTGKAIIQFFYSSSQYKSYQNTLDEIDDMKGTEFEKFLYHLFKHKGYFAKLTPDNGDFGADLVLQKGNQKIVIQAKRYSSKVGVDAIYEVLGGAGYYNANKKWVITNNYYTDKAIVLAHKNNVKLFDRDDLIIMLKEYNEPRKTKNKMRRSKNA